MNTHADKTQENEIQAVSIVDSQIKSGDESTFQFVDNRPAAVAQRKLQEMSNNSSQAKQAAQLQAMADNYSTQQQQPIQMMIWTYNDLKWVPSDWNSVDHSKKKPKDSKPAGTTYDDATETFTFPAEEKEEVVDDSPAGKAKMQKIQPFLELMGHLAGENDGSTSKGGHLLSAMKAEWGDDFDLENPESMNDAGVWVAQWSIKGNKKAGGSTMFPSSWTRDTLTAELMSSESIGDRITLMPSGIELKKAGSTFYPKV